MTVVVLFLVFISLVLLSISNDIAKTKDRLDTLYSLMWRWYTNSDAEEDEE